MQTPQPMQTLLSTATPLSANPKAPFGQERTQHPQPLHCPTSITAILR